MLHPEFGALAPHHRERVLKEAKEEPFDTIEWIGILFGLVLTVAVTRYGAADLGVVDLDAIDDGPRVALAGRDFSCGRAVTDQPREAVGPRRHERRSAAS